MANGAIFNGKEFWIGSVNNKDGTIEEVHTYEEAEQQDFHHSFYFSETQLGKISNDECSVFWVDDGEVKGEFWRNEGREPWIIGKIKEQIEMLSEPKKVQKTFEPKTPMKTKKWKEWEKPFESKLNEDVANLTLKGKRLDYTDEDAISITMDHNNEFVSVAFFAGGSHFDMWVDYEDRGLPIPHESGGDVKCAGRLWLEHKVMSFWKVDKPVKKYIDQIEKDLKEKGHIKQSDSLYNSGWLVEKYKKDENGNERPDGFMPLEEFTGKDLDEKAYQLHLMDMTAKSKKMKELGITSKTVQAPGISPVAHRDMRTKYKYTEKMKHLKSFKLYENPDTVRWMENGEKQKLKYDSPEAITFGYIDDKMYVTVKGEVISHGELCYGDRYGMTYPGRLWADHKIITFWSYPPKDELMKVIKDIEDQYNDEYVTSTIKNDETKTMKYYYDNKDKIKIDDTWQIEIVVDESGDYTSPKTKDYNKKILGSLGLSSKLVSLKEYSGSAERSEEELAILHELPPAQKAKEMKKRGMKPKKPIEPKGMTPAQYKYRTTAHKYTESFDSFENKTKKDD